MWSTSRGPQRETQADFFDRDDETPSSPAPALDPLAGGGEMGERTRAFDWSNTPIGPPAQWPRSLAIAVRIMLNSRYAMWLGWGPEFTFFYNDSYARMTLGPKHPWALGRSAREVWSEIWSDIGPRAEKVIAAGEATWDESLLLFLERRGFKEESYHTFSYSPIPSDDGGIGGMLCVVTEDTERTIGERRLRTLRELSARTTDEARSAEEACQTAARTLAENPRDLPFVAIYLLDSDPDGADVVRLAGIAGLPDDSPAAPPQIQLSEAEDQTGWPFRAALTSGRVQVVADPERRFGPLPGGAWPESPQRAIVAPLARPGQSRSAGFLIAGASPRLEFNDEYEGFLVLLANQVAAAIANARAYEEERRRAEALAELDRAKTAFFSNVSHEFRTPLTLMLGPVEDLLAHGHADLTPAAARQLEIVNRNGLRLLRLVNSLLDFSRIEASRVRAVFQAVDLAAFTADLASVFRSACERAGLQLIVDCPSIGEPAFVDRGMWEKIVFNLLSNAFKFTFDGEIAVSLRREGNDVQLRVRDTGTGIPAEEMPRLFERFHRVENARGRTHEGSGIGLALVQELVKLHSGSVTAESELGQGATFIVALPLGSNHLPADQIRPTHALESAGKGAGAPFVEEALRWLPDTEPIVLPDRIIPPREPDPVGVDERPRVLVADDNSDMRQYIVRLLAQSFQVTAAADGEAALEAARAQPPDLILTDVMMPRLNGFGLLKAIRADASLASAPVILLSARAGEESRIEGMEAGADDYLVKPFSARELLARVSAHLQIARMRREASESLRQSEERFRTLFDAMDQGFFIAEMEFDSTGRAIDFWIVAKNPAFDRHASVPVPIGKSIRELIPNLEEFWFETYGRVAQTGEPTRFVHQSRALDGRWFETAVFRLGDAENRKIAVLFTDITGRHRTEQALRDSEAHFRDMADNAPTMLWVTDASGYCTYLSSSWLEFTGRSPEQDLGFGWLENTHPDDRGQAAEIFMDANRRRIPFTIDYRLLRRDGEYRWAVDSGRPRIGEHGEFLGYIGSVIDIHDRRLAEVALLEADRRKDEFLATLAHELRNPLAPIRNGLQIIKTAGSEGMIERARAMMDRQLTQLVRLVDDLLDVSRITRGKLELRKERLELKTVIDAAVDTSRPIIEQQGHRFEIRMPDEPIILDGDPTRLAQVVANLLNNSAKYTQRAGRIRLKVEREGRKAVITVRDDGIGIPPAMIGQVFNMFTQVDRTLEKTTGGLGIGLSLAKGLVEMHGGTIAARSEGEGQGSEFVIQLPILSHLGESNRTERPADHSPDAARRRILIVDDNVDAADSLCQILKILGNEVRTAYDGEAGIEAAKTFRPDVVLCDIGMPKVNGYDAARRIRDQPWGKSISLIALTGWGQDEDRRKSSEAGFDHHLVKPIEASDLQKLLAGLKPTPG